jgi:hypothetical protein
MEQEWCAILEEGTTLEQMQKILADICAIEKDHPPIKILEWKNRGNYPYIVISSCTEHCAKVLEKVGQIDRVKWVEMNLGKHLGNRG